MDLQPDFRTDPTQTSLSVHNVKRQYLKIA